MKYILTDLDNTLLSFGPHFEDWAERAGYRIQRGVIDKTYALEDMFLDPIEFEDMFNSFFACDYTMGNFPALANTVEPIKRLKEQGFQFVGVTACNPRTGLAELRHENLKNLFGFDFEEVFVTGYSLPKSEVLKNYPASYWVEDNIRHAIEGAELGHTVFLIDQCYNQCEEGPFTRVNDWVEIEAIINGDG